MNESSFLSAHQQAILIGGGVALLFILSALVLQGGGPSRTVRWARAMIAVSVLAAIGGLAWVWAGSPLLYKSTAVVRISPKAQKIVFDTKDDASPIYAQYVSTETSVIRSPTVIERVLDRKEVRESAWYKDATKRMAGSSLDGVNLLTLQISPDYVPPAIPVISMNERLQQALEVTPRRGTELIDVSFVATSPKDARIITDAIVQEYLALKEKTDKDSGTFVRERLNEEQLRLQNEINGLIKTRFSVAEKVGTSDPEQLRTTLSADESTLANAMQEKLRELELKKRELELYQQANSRPATAMTIQFAGATTAPAQVSETAAYSRDPDWRQLYYAMRQAEYDMRTVRRASGALDPKTTEAEEKLRFATALLREREQQLQSTGMSDPSEGASTSGSTKADALRFEVDRLRHEIELMSKDRDVKKQRMKEFGETALELAKYDEDIRQKRELYEQVRLRREQLQMEDNAPTRVKIVAFAGEPAAPIHDERLTWTTLIVVGLAALVLVFRSIARTAAAA